jgi:hypothetical protein
MFTFQIIYSKLTDLLPAEVVTADDPSLERPSEDDVRETTEKTRLALERLTHTKIAAAMPVRCAERAVSIILWFYLTVCSVKKFLYLLTKSSSVFFLYLCRSSERRVVSGLRKDCITIYLKEF